MLSSQLHTDWNSLYDQASGWDRLLSSCYRGILGPDATSSSVWARALWDSHVRDSTLRSLTITSNQQLVAIVPAYLATAASFPFARRELRLMTEAYGGRGGLLIADDDPTLVESAFARLRAEIPDWDVFVFSVVAGSASQSAVSKAAQASSLRMRCLAVNESPHVELGSSWDATFASLPKKLRWTIRKAEKDLRAQGRLEYLEVVAPAAVPSLIQHIYDVEQRSWKESAGTSITTQQRQQAFYEKFAPLAAQSGILSAHVLLLDGRAIAYILGVAAGDGVFLDLKESFDAACSDYSPGHVLKRFAIEALIARGVRTYDFMGRCEPYKMKWTDKTYRSLTLALFNSTFRGWLCHARSAMGKASEPVPPAPATTSAAL